MPTEGPTVRMIRHCHTLSDATSDSPTVPTGVRQFRQSDSNAMYNCLHIKQILIEHTQNAQGSLVLQGQGLGTSRKTLWMDGYRSSISSTSSTVSNRSRTTSRASVCIIEHTRNAQESLVLQGQGLGTSRKTVWMDGCRSSIGSTSSTVP